MLCLRVWWKVIAFLDFETAHIMFRIATPSVFFVCNGTNKKSTSLSHGDAFGGGRTYPCHQFMNFGFRSPLEFSPIGTLDVITWDFNPGTRKLIKTIEDGSLERL